MLPKLRTHWPRLRVIITLAAAAGLIGGAVAIAPALTSGRTPISIHRVDMVSADNATVSSAAQPATVYSYPGTGTVATPTSSTLSDGTGVTIQCYLTGITPADGGSGAQDGDPYWDQIASSGLPSLPAGNAAVVPDSSLHTSTGTPVTQLVSPCADGGPAAPGPAPAVQGGCKPYQVQAASIGSFSMTVCISDNGTGTTAYPSVIVDQVPAYLGTSCTIAVELWDDNSRSYGTPGQAGCAAGDYKGNSFGPVTAPVTLHAFARLKICLFASCTSYYLSHDEGDSPSIQLAPFVRTKKTPTTKTSAKPLPIPPLPVGGNRQQQADCLDSMPTSGPTSFVQSNGAGWNEYTTVGGDGTRPGTATACLDQSHVAGTKATVAAARVVGMQDAYTEVDNWNRDPDPNNQPATQIDGTQRVQRCHLIGGSNAIGTSLGMTVSGRGSGGSLGGDGRQAGNLVPCWQNVNTGNGSAETNMTSMQQVENNVRQQVDNVPAGSAIYYQVTPNYGSPSSTIPSSITMVAYLQIPGMPSPGQLLPGFPITIPNASSVRTVAGGNATLNLGN